MEDVTSNTYIAVIMVCPDCHEMETLYKQHQKVRLFRRFSRAATFFSGWSSLFSLADWSESGSVCIMSKYRNKEESTVIKRIIGHQGHAYRSVKQSSI